MREDCLKPTGLSVTEGTKRLGIGRQTPPLPNDQPVLVIGGLFVSATRHVQDLHYLYRRISKVPGAKFRFHGLRKRFITVAERELMLHPSLTKRLVNHARPNDVTEGYAAD